MSIPVVLRPVLEKLSGKVVRVFRQLDPFIKRGVEEGLSLPKMYSALRAEAVGIARPDFYRYAGFLREHYLKAVAVREIPRDEPFLITRLPQEQSVLENRFWARRIVTVQDIEGKRFDMPLTVGFDEKMTIGEIEELEIEELKESLRQRGLSIVGIRVSEIYKQW